MKITFVISGTIKSNFSYRALQLARSLNKRGHEVTIICPSADKYNNFNKEKIKNIDGVGIIQPFQFSTYRMEINLFPYILHTLWILFRNKSDLVYIYKPTPISVVGIIGKIVNKSKLVLDMDDMGSEVMKIEGHPSYQVKLVEWSERLAGKYADKIVVTSSYLEKYYRNRYKDKPILVVSNAVDSDWFKPVVQTQEKNKIIFLGAINRKNIIEPLFDVLPFVIKKVPDVKVKIVGDGKFLNYFKDKTKNMGVQDYVEFTGWVNLDEAQDMLHAGDVGYNYMPDEVTTRSASNMKVPQYMARGVVPVVSEVGDLPSYVDYGKAGYVLDSDRVDSLRDVLVEALLDVDRTKKSLNAADYSKTRFSWDILAERFEKWFNGLSVESFDTSTIKKKSVYFLAVNVPGNNSGGSEVRDLNVLDAWLKVEKVRLTNFLISSDDDKKDQEFINRDSFFKNIIVPKAKNNIFRTLKLVFWDRLPPFFGNILSSGINKEFYNKCEEELPDIVQLEQVHAFYAINKYIDWLKSKNVKIILDCHNVESILFKESIDIFPWYKKIVARIMTGNFDKLEKLALSKADLVLCCSEKDKDYLSKYNNNIVIVPNGVDAKIYFNDTLSNSKEVIFTGGVEYTPNADAIKFFIKNIHPKIKNKVRDYKLTVIGATDKWLSSNGLKDEVISGKGYVEDIIYYLKKANVGVCPIRYGSGTRLKILTYMAAGLPVVSTTKGAEGVNYTNDENIFLRNDPAEFAESVTKLLEDYSYAEKIGKAGQDFVVNNLDWEIIKEDLSHIYKKI